MEQAKVQKLTISQIRAIESRQSSIVNRCAQTKDAGMYSAEEKAIFKEQLQEVSAAIRNFANSLTAKDFPVLDTANIEISDVYLVDKVTGNNLRYANYKPGHDKVVAKLNDDFQAMIDKLYLEGLSDQVREDYKHLLEI